MIRNNVDEYRNFLNEHIPKSNIINTDKTNYVYTRVVENLLVTEIFKNCIGECEIECYLDFLEDYKNQFNKILLYIGINDYNSVTYCIRSLIENLLKFIYSIYIVESKENISKLSFRNIKDDLNEFYQSGLEINLELIMKLCDIYGKYSNVIHGKSSNQASIQYIVEIIEKENKQLNDIDKILLNIVDIYEDIMSEILCIEYLSTNDLLTLRKSISSNRFNKLKKRLLNKTTAL